MENEQNIKVSIIVPVYNVPEKALCMCIESAMKQTLEEIEIILVDDGSTDNSGNICDEYEKQDYRISVIHKKNEGLSAARNSGYRIASGCWITFLDGDDWIEAETCQENYELAERQNVDVLMFGTVQEFGHYKKPFRYNFQNNTSFYGEECKKLQCEILNFTGNIATAWAKLIKKSVLDKHSIEHNKELRQGSEGIEFNVRLFEYIEKAYFVDKIYYHYVYNSNSISAKHDDNNHYIVIKCFEEIQKQILLSKNKNDLEKLFYNRFLYTVIATAIGGYFSPTNKQLYYEKRKSFKKYMSNALVQNTIKNGNTHQLDIFRKMAFFCIKRGWFLALSVMAFIRHTQKN